MTLTVKTTLDGAGNAYVSLPEAEVYFVDRNDRQWMTATPIEKEAGIIRATQYIDASYCFLPGIEGVPQAVKDACCELAILGLKAPLIGGSATPQRDKRRVKAGSVEVEYAASPLSADQERFRLVNRLLRDLTVSTGGGLVGRAVRG